MHWHQEMRRGTSGWSSWPRSPWSGATSPSPAPRAPCELPELLDMEGDNSLCHSPFPRLSPTVLLARHSPRRSRRRLLREQRPRRPTRATTWRLSRWETGSGRCLGQLSPATCKTRHSVSCTHNLGMQSVLHARTHARTCTHLVCPSLIVQDWGTPSSRRKVLNLYSYIILWFRQAPFVTHDPRSIRGPAEPPNFYFHSCVHCISLVSTEQRSPRPF